MNNAFLFYHYQPRRSIPYHKKCTHRKAKYPPRKNPFLVRFRKWGIMYNISSENPPPMYDIAKTVDKYTHTIDIAGISMYNPMHNKEYNSTGGCTK